VYGPSAVVNSEKLDLLLADDENVFFLSCVSPVKIVLHIKHLDHIGNPFEWVR